MRVFFCFVFFFLCRSGRRVQSLSDPQRPSSWALSALQWKSNTAVSFPIHFASWNGWATGSPRIQLLLAHIRFNLQHNHCHRHHRRLLLIIQKPLPLSHFGDGCCWWLRKEKRVDLSTVPTMKYQKAISLRIPATAWPRLPSLCIKAIPEACKLHFWLFRSIQFQTQFLCIHNSGLYKHCLERGGGWKKRLLTRLRHWAVERECTACPGWSIMRAYV